MDKEEIVRKIEKGKVDIFDIDRDEDLMWAVADLYCIEKHLNLTINFIKKKLEENPKDEYYQKLYEVATNLLNGVRVERAKHLKRLVKFKEFGFWCIYKHFLGGMMQFGEVGAKDLYMGDKENAKLDFETSSFCHDAIILLNQLNKLKKVKKDVKT